MDKDVQQRIHFPVGKEKLKADFAKVCAKMKNTEGGKAGRSANSVIIEFMEKTVTASKKKGGKK